MTDDVYRSAGRGGAGNFQPKKVADNAEKDLEKQELEAAAIPTPEASAPTPARGGRGGAGNFMDAADAREHERQDARLTDRLKKHTPRGGTGLGGRGGAGNYQQSQAAADEERAREEREQNEKGEGLEQKIKEQIDAVLKLPEKVHHGQEKTKH